MIFVLVLNLVAGLIAIVLGIFNVPVVTELPDGLDSALVSFVQNINSVREAWPPLVVLFDGILLWFAITFALSAFTFAKWIVNLIRGSGT